MMILFSMTGCVFFPGSPCSGVEARNVEVLPRSSPGTKYALLPAPVQHTVLIYGGSAEIKDIKEIATDQPMYQVRFADCGLNPDLFILPDGLLINSEERYLHPNPLTKDVPPSPRSTLDQRKKAP